MIFNIARLEMGERVHIAAKFENTIRDAGSTSHKLHTLPLLLREAIAGEK